MKAALTISILAALLSASNTKTHSTRFGFARVSLVLYSWALPPVQPPRFPYIRTSAVDSNWSFRVWRYVQVDSTGECTLLSATEISHPRKWSHPSLPPSADSILKGLESLSIDSLYPPPVDRFEIYDGPSFCLIVERKDGSQTLSLYDPRDLPDNIRRFHQFMFALQGGAPADSMPSINFHAMADRIGRREAHKIARPFRSNQ